MNFEILKPMENSYDLNILTEYFKFNYKCNASYHNPYSLLLFASKLSRRYPDKIPFEITMIQKKIVALISHDMQMIHLVGAKNKDESQAILKKLMRNQTLSVFLHFPNFKPKKSWKIERTYNQILISCGVFSLKNGLNQVGKQIGLNNRSLSTLRKNHRELTTFKIEKKHLDDLYKILELWGDKAKKRGVYTLGVEKDQVCFNLINKNLPDLVGWISYRGDYPVGYNIITTLPKNSTCAVLIGSKSLNYKEQPGGYNETSLYTLIRLLNELNTIGVRLLNLSGGADQHSPLYKFKKKFSNSTVQIHEYSITNYA